MPHPPALVTRLALALALALATVAAPCQALAEDEAPASAPEPARQAIERPVEQPAENDEAAYSRYQEGVTAMKADDYAKAIDLLTKSYELSPNRATLRALAQATELSGNCKRAIALYELYISAEPTEAQKADARDHIGFCQRHAPSAAPKTTEAAGAELVPTSVPTPVPSRSAAVVAAAPERRRAPFATNTWGHVLAGSGLALGASGGIVFATQSSTPTRSMGFGLMGLGLALVAGGVAQYLVEVPTHP